MVITNAIISRPCVGNTNSEIDIIDIDKCIHVYYVCLEIERMVIDNRRESNILFP